MRFWKSVVVLTCLIAFASATFTASYAELDAFFSAEFSAQNLVSFKIPSASVAVVTADGTVVYDKGFGWQNYAAGIRAMSNQTIYRLASLSKTFAGTTAMQVLERGLANLTTDLNYYFSRLNPPFQVKNQLVGDYNPFAGNPTFPTTPLTLWDILTQTCGLDSGANQGTLASYTERIPLLQYYQTSLPARIRPAGQVVTYSNNGIGLIGLLVEAVTGYTWQRFLQLNVLNPLKMLSTYPELDATLYNSPNRQQYQVYLPGDVIVTNPQLDEFELSPAGGLWSTATDMAKFAAAHLNGGLYAPTNTRILSSASAASMHAPQFSSYPGIDPMGFVWFHGQLNNVSFIEHDGNLPGFNNRLRLYVDEGVAIVLLSNSDAAHGFPFLASIADRFQNTFMKPFNCSTSGIPGAVSSPALGCLVPGRNFPNSLGPQANAAVRYAAVLGDWIGYRYTHNTWQKFGGYEENMHAMTVIEPGYLAQGASCFVELNGGLFYLGFPAGGDCYLPYPFSGQFLRAFRTVYSPGNNTLATTYFVSQSTLDERPPHSFAISWIPVLVIYILLFFLFMLVVLPVMLCCFCCTRCQPANTADSSSNTSELKMTLVGAPSTESAPAMPAISEYSPIGVTVFALGSHFFASLLYAASLISTFLLLQKQIYIGFYGPVIGTMGAAAAGVAFAALSLIGTVAIKIMTRIRWPLFIFLLIYTFVHISYILVLLQWNWLGPGFVLAA